MGEAKRRKEMDPTFGKKRQVTKENPVIAQIKKMSRLELIFWAIFLSLSLASVGWAFVKI